MRSSSIAPVGRRRGAGSPGHDDDAGRWEDAQRHDDSPICSLKRSRSRSRSRHARRGRSRSPDQRRRRSSTRAGREAVSGIMVCTWYGIPCIASIFQLDGMSVPKYSLLCIGLLLSVINVMRSTCQAPQHNRPLKVAPSRFQALPRPKSSAALAGPLPQSVLVAATRAGLVRLAAAPPGGVQSITASPDAVAA